MAETSNQPPKDMMGFLEYYLVQKAPFQLPDNAREAIVKYGPWVVLVLLVLTIPALLLLLGIGTALVPFGGAAYGVGFGYLALFVIVEIGLEAASLPGLFKRKMSGWTLMFWSRMIGLVYSLLAGAILSGLIGAVISFYLLFQVRALYKS
jgi:hypothetical protein